MARHALFVSIAMLFYQFDLASGQTEPQFLQTPGIRTVPRDTLSDLAVAYADPDDPIVYYNPRLMERMGPEISAFVLAHERAHILLGHRRPQAGMAREALERLLQSWELDADCLAAAWLARERPSALEAATTFFLRMGPGRVDPEHPIGSVRAAQLEACGRTRQGDPRSLSEGPHATIKATWFK